MYNARIVTDAGKSFEFSYNNGVLFDISPLSGIDISLATSQGFGQIGESVEGQGIKGITRTISGKLLNDAVAKQMLSALPVFTTGKLYFNDTHYCDIYVKKTPSFTKSGITTRFSMQVFCTTPFWKQKNSIRYSINVLTKLFKFPVVYNTHKFGESGGATFVNCFNSGDVAVPMKVVFTSSSSAVNFGIINQRTLKESRFVDTLSEGEIVTLWQEKGRIMATKETEGEITDYLGYLGDSSDLFNAEVGDNILKVVADSGEDYITASVELTPAFMGVLA